MGGCCPCWKSSGDTNEYTPIATRGEQTTSRTGNFQETRQPLEKNSSQYYQSVIDSAQRKFISTGQRIFPREDRADELRNKIKQANISTDVISPPQKRSFLQWGSNHSSQQVVDILSAPVVVNNYDVVADDLAEMAATYTFKLSADDTTNSTVASFRPVNSS